MSPLSKVLVLGSTGCIGHQIYNYLKSNNDFQLFNISRSRLNDETILYNFSDDNLSFDPIKKIKPDYIINCMGILSAESKNNIKDAILLNSYLPHKLLDISNEINSKLIHISTDCVFSGEKINPYYEYDYLDGKDNYSKTKGLGEIFSNNHLTIRTSVIGPELSYNGNLLFNWFMKQEKKIKGYLNSFWSGVTTYELARAVKWSIDNNINGIYHITNNKKITKYEILNLFKKFTGKKIDIIPFSNKINDKSFLDTRKEINYIIPDYDLMIKNMIQEIRKNLDLYNHYLN